MRTSSQLYDCVSTWLHPTRVPIQCRPLPIYQYQLTVCYYTTSKTMDTEKNYLPWISKLAVNNSCVSWRLQ